MNKPHLRICEWKHNGNSVWHCSMRRSNFAGMYWSEYGYTWREALDKMEARLSRHGKLNDEPSNLGQYP